MNVCFFFPDRNLGGGPYYLLNLALELAKDKSYKVYYIDYKDGYSHTLLNDTQEITFIDYEDNNYKCYFHDECILFMPIYYLHLLPWINMNSKVLFFNWHHECLPVLKNNMHFSYNELFEFMSLVKINNAQVFCDYAHWDANNKISACNFLPKFVPVHIANKTQFVDSKLINQTVANIAILGRLVIDKIYSVKNIILLANKSKYKFINIHIIGDGDNSILKQVSLRNGVKIIYHGEQRGEYLLNCLNLNADVLFAMGTSVLEGAMLKIPSVIIPYSIRDYESNSFIYLFNTKDYTLGWDLSQISSNFLSLITFDDVLDDIYVRNLKASIGSKCYDYACVNHLVSNSVEKLKVFLGETSLTFERVYQIYKKQCFVNFVKESEKVKYVFKLMGVPIFCIKKTGRTIKLFLFKKFEILSIGKLI